jgi:ATP-dependent exoDNAse (exonuclease V) beta subunit
MHIAQQFNSCTPASTPDAEPLPLTEEQQRAAAAASARVFIEAAPGSGKTT